jgi:hypothetical protein
VVNLRDKVKTEEVQLHAFFGNCSWDDVVSLPKNRQSGDVLAGSFVHVMLKENDMHARKLQDPGPWKDAIVDWTRTTEHDDIYGPDSTRRTFVTGIPHRAIKFAKAAYDTGKQTMDQCGIRITDLSLTCAPVHDSVPSESGWTSLAKTRHSDALNSPSAATVLRESFQSIGILFKLRGFW